MYAILYLNFVLISVIASLIFNYYEIIISICMMCLFTVIFKTNFTIHLQNIEYTGEDILFIDVVCLLIIVGGLLTISNLFL
jgi:hypothetical protein